MTPILFGENETQFQTNGIGRLMDTINMSVSEVRDGEFEIEFTYPISGRYYSEIIEGRRILVSHDESGDLQPFIIYKRSAPMNGLVTFNAYHISYLLNGITVMPFTATGIADAMAQIVPNSANTNPFTFWTDKVTDGQFALDVPKAIRPVLGGSENSLLDVYGSGEYEFDKWTVKLYQNRGTDSGVTIRYGKNLSDITQDIDASDYYNAVAPYWKKDDTVVTLPEGYVAHSDIGSAAVVCIPLDLSSEFEEEPTVADLRTKALNKLNNSTAMDITESIKVDFVQLWQTEEYKDYAPLQRVKLCDTVQVIYEALGINISKKVIKVVWDPLQERYTSMELGDASVTLADVMIQIANEQLEDVPTTSMMDDAIRNATNLITGGTGGYIVLKYNADGKPEELLALDNEDINQALNVIRINKNGIGFSSTGYNGPYRTAWTIDGNFVADFITTGTMSANRIKGGVLSLGGLDNGSGVFELRDANNLLIARLDKDGFKSYGSDGSYVLMNNSVGFAGFDSNGTKIYWVAADEFHMVKAVIEDEITLCNELRFIKMTDSATGSEGIGLVSVGG